MGDILGYVATLICTLMQFPQVYQTWATQNGDSLSYATLSLNTANCVLWLIYGILIEEGPVILANCAFLMASVLLLAMKFAYRADPKADEIDSKLCSTELAPC